MCGDSGIRQVASRYDDTDSIDDLIDEGDLRRRDVRANLADWVGESHVRAIQEMLDDNDGRES